MARFLGIEIDTNHPAVTGNLVAVGWDARTGNTEVKVKQPKGIEYIVIQTATLQGSEAELREQALGDGCVGCHAYFLMSFKDGSNQLVGIVWLVELHADPSQ